MEFIFGTNHGLVGSFLHFIDSIPTPSKLFLLETESLTSFLSYHT